MNKKDLMILMIQTTSLMSYYIIILVNSVELLPSFTILALCKNIH